MNATIEPRATQLPTLLEETSWVSQEGAPGSRLKVAYLMSRFPKLTETFILYEMLALERQGVQVEVYPLLRAQEKAVKPEGGSLIKKVFSLMSQPRGALLIHPEAAQFVERAHYEPFLSWKIVAANLYYLFRKPGAYFGALWTVLRANWGSSNYLAGVLSVFLKTAYFARQMVEQGVSHVHAHFANHPAAAAFIIHRLTGIPYSFTAHGADLQVDQHMLCEKVAEAQFVVTISNYNKSLIKEKCGPAAGGKINVIRCGVDTEQFQPAFRDLGLERLFTILCIGTFYEVKGHTYLIEALRLLKQQGVNFICQLVGDGPDRQSLEAQVEQAGLVEQVRFLGQKTRQEVIALMQAAACLVVPSIPTASGRREGLPVVLVEALGSGLPVVASNISGIPELVEQGRSGLLVPPRDPAALAAALQRLAGDPGLRRRLGLAGREKVLREFDLDANVAALAEFFRGKVSS